MSTEPGPASREAGSETAILIAVALVTMLAPLNSTMIGVALPEIMGEFATDLGTGSWLVIAYLITMASLQPVGGKLGDRFELTPEKMEEMVNKAVEFGQKIGEAAVEWFPHLGESLGLLAGVRELIEVELGEGKLGLCTHSISVD